VNQLGAFASILLSTLQGGVIDSLFNVTMSLSKERKLTYPRSHMVRRPGVGTKSV
jgi:hypothetical protein